MNIWAGPDSLSTTNGIVNFASPQPEGHSRCEQQKLFSGRVGVADERMCLSLPSFLMGSAFIRAKWLHEEHVTSMDSAIQEWE